MTERGRWINTEMGRVLDKTVSEDQAERITSWVEDTKKGRPIPTKDTPMFVRSRRIWDVEGSELFLYSNAVFKPGVGIITTFGLMCNEQIAHQLEKEEIIQLDSVMVLNS